MAIDYKKQAINCYITEMYCDTKYPSKYKDLIERASVMPEMDENNNPVSNIPQSNLFNFCSLSLL